VFRLIHTALLFCPVDYFDTGGRGWWLISREDSRQLPQEIKCLIRGMEFSTVKRRDENDNKVTESTLRIRFVSKEAMMFLAAKHQLGKKIDVRQFAGIDLDGFFIAVEEKRTRIEEQIARARP